MSLKNLENSINPLLSSIFYVRWIRNLENPSSERYLFSSQVERKRGIGFQWVISQSISFFRVFFDGEKNAFAFLPPDSK
jgi:hypothetical protein